VAVVDPPPVSSVCDTLAERRRIANHINEAASKVMKTHLRREGITYSQEVYKDLSKKLWGRVKKALGVEFTKLSEITSISTLNDIKAVFDAYVEVYVNGTKT
jgi:hypothetical protein